MNNTTTQQMVNAPKNSVFIWHSEYIDYPLKLAFHIGREDLEIVGPSWCKNNKEPGRTFTKHYTYKGK